jgi:SAM-dependent methyltransferase
MADLIQHDPLRRFTGLADVYARSRPDYPSAAMDFILHHGGLGVASRLVDIGCGTGISSRQFAQRGLHVTGIEPNADMRRKAEAEAEHQGRIEYREGTAEATGLPDESADAVAAAQAFHWFATDAALGEFRRILRLGGWMIVMANERDEDDPATAAYGAIIGGTPEAVAVEKPRRAAAGVLSTSALFVHHERRRFGHEQIVDEDGLLGRAFSASYAPREPAAAGQFAAALRQVFAEYQQQGTFRLQYVTTVDMAQRPEA